MANEILIDKGGPVLQRAKIVLSFRGSGWRTGSISSSEVRRAFEAVLASPYLSTWSSIAASARDRADHGRHQKLGQVGSRSAKFVAGNIWLLADEDIRNVARIALRARPSETTRRCST